MENNVESVSDQSIGRLMIFRFWKFH